MKHLFVVLLSVLCFVILPFNQVIAHASAKYTSTPKRAEVEKKVHSKAFKIWKVQKKRHSNPAPIFLIIALVAAAGAVAVYFLTPMVVVAAVLGAIAFIAFILYFVYSGAN